MLLAAALIAAAAAGCDANGRNLTLDSLFKRLVGPSPSECVAMAFASPDDPDRRREGVTLLSKKSFGLQGKYLKGYAIMAKKDSRKFELGIRNEE